MTLELSSEQTAQLELISIYMGKSTAQVLSEAALHLLTKPVGLVEPEPVHWQRLLSPADVDARFARILGRAAA